MDESCMQRPFTRRSNFFSRNVAIFFRVASLEFSFSLLCKWVFWSNTSGKLSLRSAGSCKIAMGYVWGGGGVSFWVVPKPIELPSLQFQEESFPQIGLLCWGRGLSGSGMFFGLFSLISFFLLSQCIGENFSFLHPTPLALFRPSTNTTFNGA
jgi:hypothetical protein